MHSLMYCNKCFWKEATEAMQKINLCPDCGSHKVRTIFHEDKAMVDSAYNNMKNASLNKKQEAAVKEQVLKEFHEFVKSRSNVA